MKTSLSSFTRGSQLIGHFVFMFAAGLRAPLWLAALTLGGIVGWRLYDGLSGHEHYLILTRLQGLAWRFMEFDPTKAVTVKLMDGGTVQLPYGELLAWPPLALAWKRMIEVATGGLETGALALAPLLAGYFWYSRRFGAEAKERRHERGAALVGLPELRREIEARNAPERKTQLREIFGPTWPLKSRLTSQADMDRAGIYRPYALAGVPFPWGREQSHAMLIGTTGTGKTVLLRDLLAQARERQASAVVFDLTGAFIEAFYDPQRDVILNPLDERCPYWSIFDECEDEAEFTAVAEALVPHDGGTSEPFWIHAARMLFVETCMRLKALGRATNQALATELMTADLKHVHRLVQGTVADPITAPEAARMAESVRAVFNTNAKALLSLPEMPRDGEVFSVKRWVWGQRAPGSLLFLSARYVDMSLARVLLTMWMDQAINTLMTTERARTPKLWFMLDELGALHRLPALEKGLQTARQYGGAIILGIHSFAKLRDTYGENMANTLASLARTKIILATADRITATWGSDFIGHAQFKDVDESYSYGYNNVRDAVSMTPRRVVEPLVLPDQIMNLPSLVGYVKFPDGFAAASLKIPVRNYPEVAHGFMKRRDAGAPSPLAPAGERGAGEGGRSPTLEVPAARSGGAEAQYAGAPDVSPASERRQGQQEDPEDSQETQGGDGGPGVEVEGADAGRPKQGADEHQVRAHEPLGRTNGEGVAADDAKTAHWQELLARQVLNRAPPSGRRSEGEGEAAPSAGSVPKVFATGRSAKETARTPVVDSLGAQRDPSWATPPRPTVSGPADQGLRELRDGLAFDDRDAGIGD